MALPFDLPEVSRGFAALSPSSRRLGGEIAAAAASALGRVLDTAVEVRGRAVQGRAWPRTPAARLALELAALPARAAVEVEPALVVCLLDRLAGGDGALPGATAASSLTPLEQAAFELLTLLALDAACSVDGVEAALAPRLAARGAEEPDGALDVELELAVGAIQGRARLLVPAAAVRALGGEAAPGESRLRVPVSLRRGTASLLPEELEALAPGDLLLVTEPGDGREALVLPGGFRAAGRLAADGFHVEETTMSTRSAQIPVTLEVELCRVELPLSELARLAPGAVLPVPVDRRGQVTLRVGDRAVGRGELVEIEGAVGVRLDSLEGEP